VQPPPAAKKQEKAAGAEDSIAIYFGSQSGTAEGFAHEIEQEAAEKGLGTAVIDLEDFDPEEFAKHKVVILVVATYGEGDPTDNAVEFFKWLKDEAEEELMQGSKFCVMGLGNRQYVNFNSCGKMADEHLERIGGERIYELGVGDDDQNIEEDFEQWKENGLWPALLKACGKEGADASQEHQQQTAESVVASLQLRAEVQEDAKKLPVDPLVQVGGADILGKWYFQSHLAAVVSERELRQVADATAGKTTKHLDIDVKSIPAIDWRTADNLEVLPRNPTETVDWFAERLGVAGDLEHSIGFVRAKGVERPVKKPFPTPCTVRDALTLYCDLCQAPGRQFLKKLAAFVSSEEERKVVADLAEDRHTYQWLTGEGVRLTFRELLELFCPSLQIDISAFLQLCPRQKSRPYTIASSSREDKTKIGVCVSVVVETFAPLSQVVTELAGKGYRPVAAEACLQRLGEAASAPRSFRGVCSSMLCCDVAVGDRLWVVSRPSTFRLPRRTTIPIVMVGAGTGVAPFRAFAREFRAEQGIRKKTTLFFGCTKSDQDFLYKDEFQEALDSEPKALGELVTAFSREQAEKVYVQHRLRERAADVAALVKEGGYVYVCGALAMGAAIREELASALGSADHVTRLVTEGLFVEELW